MYELLVLSLLMHWPLHAYRIAKIGNEIIGPEEQISTGTLSSLLNRLVQAGLITPAGRERFFELMLDTSSHPGTYRRLFHLKALHLEFLPVENQLFLLEHSLAYCRQVLRSKQAEAQDMADDARKQEHMSPSLRKAAMALIQLKIEQWQLELAWGQSLHTQTLLRFKQHGEALAAPGEESSNVPR